MDKGPDGWTGTPSSPQHETINYKIIDDDGAEANAKYMLTIHDPVELIREDITAVSIEVPLFKPNGEPVTTDSTSGATHGDISVSDDTSFSDGWSVSGTFDLSEWTHVFGIDAAYQQSSEHGVGTTSTLPFDVNPGEYAQAFVEHVYDRHHLFFWCYDEAGLIPRYATHGTLDPQGGNVDPHPAADGESRIVPDEGWYDKFNRTTVPTWKGPFPRSRVAPTQSNTPTATPSAPSNTYS